MVHDKLKAMGQRVSDKSQTFMDTLFENNGCQDDAKFQVKLRDGLVTVEVSGAYGSDKYPDERLVVCNLSGGLLLLEDIGNRPMPVKDCMPLLGAVIEAASQSSRFRIKQRCNVAGEVQGNALGARTWDIDCGCPARQQAWVQHLQDLVGVAEPQSSLDGPATVDLRQWMGQLECHLRGKQLCDVAMPGSHDAGTYGMTLDHQFIPCYKGPPKVVLKYFKKDAVKWSRAQRLDIRGQLEAGSRYLDLRIVRNPEDGQFWTCHGLFSNTLRDVLQGLTDFLSTTNREVVLLDIQELHESNYCEDDRHGMTNASCKELAGLFTEFLGPWLMPKRMGLGCTMADIWEAGYRVILIHNRDSLSLTENEWCREHTLRSDWKDKDALDDLFVALHAELGHKPKDKLWVLQAVLTPTPMTTIKAHLPGSVTESLEDCANYCKRQLLPLLSGHWHRHSLGVVMTDMCDDPILNEATVRLNLPPGVASRWGPTSAMTVSRACTDIQEHMPHMGHLHEHQHANTH
uniref:Phosphatidylinositol-specific phospholipase C X domain-containing protein n=1 Tax=Eutreptiella gymnastica TaxID=73025 RepID=A0A7S4LP66_9EUGL